MLLDLLNLIMTDPIFRIHNKSAFVDVSRVVRHTLSRKHFLHIDPSVQVIWHTCTSLVALIEYDASFCVTCPDHDELIVEDSIVSQEHIQILPNSSSEMWAFLRELLCEADGLGAQLGHFFVIRLDESMKFGNDFLGFCVDDDHRYFEYL